LIGIELVKMDLEKEKKKIVYGRCSDSCLNSGRILENAHIYDLTINTLLHPHQSSADFPFHILLDNK